MAPQVPNNYVISPAQFLQSRCRPDCQETPMKPVELMGASFESMELFSTGDLMKPAFMSRNISQPIDCTPGVELVPPHTVGETQLKKPSVRLESCDKIWETLQLIKNIQDDSCVIDRSSQPSTSNDFIDSNVLHSIEPCQQKEDSRSRALPHSEAPMNGRFDTKEVTMPPGAKRATNHFQGSENNGSRSSTTSASKSKSALRSAHSAKEKWKCILCPRLSMDIVHHLRVFHKVTRVSAIIQQCEKFIPKSERDMTDGDPMIIKKTESHSKPLPDGDSHLSKRKQSTFDRPGSEKKRRLQQSISANSTPIINKPFGPYKCDVCLGLYKSQKTFVHHQSLHRRRGQTRENFGSFICRFKNSPLCITNVDKEPDKTIIHTPVQPKLPKSQTAITSYFERLTKSVDQQNHFESQLTTKSQKLETGSVKRNSQERATCECGKSFRSLHSLCLHQVQCKKSGNEEDNQAVNDTSIGLDKGIDKKENDVCEQVLKEVSSIKPSVQQRISEDSDASSNDSGMVLVESNRKISQCQVPEYKSHSIMRIQIAEDDEDVDIEDEVSDPGLDKNCISVAFKPSLISGVVASDHVNDLIPESFQSDSPIALGKEQDTVQTRSNLCSEDVSSKKESRQRMDTNNPRDLKPNPKQGLITDDLKMKESVDENQCMCGKKFTHIKYFNIHVRRCHPQLLKCSYCRTNFDKVETFLDHSCTILEGQLFIEPILQTKCLKCNAPVDIGDSFDKHMKTHDPEGPTVYQCFKCDKKFNNIHQRQCHFSKEHGVSPCSICGKRMHIDQLNEHEAYHEGLGHPCHLCRKTFTQKTLLKKHLHNTHNPRANEIITCSVCSQRVKLKFLKKHLSLHLHTEICGRCDKCDERVEKLNPGEVDIDDGIHDEL
ncbi:hypothetical protein QAD02_000331 [Eretmocerus hayati]|uniref:Uncharacterized protein n=1 Tax=Eretmocerus hayati TaxID=131215 RepID=A0ACC2NFP7_9HYME|nr:hypothetical protein QAD02_000331 [Eretmocerus hayati]